MRAGRAVAGLAVLGLVAGFGFWLGHHWDPADGPRLPGFGPDCSVEAGGQVHLDHDQMGNAATITAVGVRLGMPDRATVVALATAFQESKLRNLPHLGDNNDHDSVGLFQQRPSQGWGTPEQVGDPRYASERFYYALADVDGWEEMRVTDAAQQVQRSAFPEAYQKWAGDAEVLATALLGRAGGAVTCAVRDDPPLSGEEAAAGLRTELVADWGEEVAVEVVDPPGLTVAAADPDTGWRYAHWLVAHAAAHSITRVHFADAEWTAETGTWSETDSIVDRVQVEVASPAADSAAG